MINKMIDMECKDKHIYLVTKPSQYLFEDLDRKIPTDIELIKWWLHFWKTVECKGHFYVPNEDSTLYLLPENVEFGKFDSYDFKKDGIDCPWKNWDEMTEYLGCFSLHVTVEKSHKPLMMRVVCEKLFDEMVSFIRHGSFLQRIIQSDYPFIPLAVKGFNEYKEERDNLKEKQEMKKVVNITDLIKKRKSSSVAVTKKTKLK